MVKAQDKRAILKQFLWLVWNSFLFIAMGSTLSGRSYTSFVKCVFLKRSFSLKQNQKLNNLGRNGHDSCWRILLSLKTFIRHKESVH